MQHGNDQSATAFCERNEKGEKATRRSLDAVVLVTVFLSSGAAFADEPPRPLTLAFASDDCSSEWVFDVVMQKLGNGTFLMDGVAKKEPNDNLWSPVRGAAVITDQEGTAEVVSRASLSRPGLAPGLSLVTPM